jgi:ADP-dependent NAD(P)H-hydrate dehydratase / NAD(P)H-hydrate epimerase
MKIFTAAQVADLDNYTVLNEPITPIDLMERAATGLVNWIDSQFDNKHRIAVFAGPGNNGGDALALARLLSQRSFQISVFIPDQGIHRSECFLKNLERLPNHVSVITLKWSDETIFPNLAGFDLLIDGLFGSGLNRPLSGFSALLVRHLNNSSIPIIAIDIPSGLMGEENRDIDPEQIIKATYTLTFEFPKLSFFFKENRIFTGSWVVLPIGIHTDGIAQIETSFYFSDSQSMAPLLKPREWFSHKGTYGHALLVAGSYGKMGAAVLAAKGCLRSGVGLLTVNIPAIGIQIMQTAVPEAIVSTDEPEKIATQIQFPSLYKAVGIGPGIGKAPQTVEAFRSLLLNCHVPLVIDADGLNILSENPEMLELLPSGTILTPHPTEFKRLAGDTGSDFDRLALARKFAHQHQVILILKGAYTAILFPDSTCRFNSTGNPGMATAGSGDVLTGILLGLLAQGYAAHDAACLGVYLHGLSGDLIIEGSSEEALLAGELADHLGKAFYSLKNHPDLGKPKKKHHF